MLLEYFVLIQIKKKIKKSLFVVLYLKTIKNQHMNYEKSKGLRIKDQFLKLKLQLIGVVIKVFHSLECEKISSYRYIECIQVEFKQK